MKVTIGKYVDWFGPFQLAEKLLFWMDKNDDRVYNLGHFLAYGTFKDEMIDLFDNDRDETWLYKFLSWIHSKKHRKVKMHIDPWDTWNMDSTLSMIILPMLKQLKATKHGAPWTDDEDVPEGLGLRSTEAPPKKDEWDTDANHFKRWDWIMDEMIWTFEQLQPDYDWEEQYHSGNIEFKSELLDNGMYELKRGPNDTSTFDKEGHQAHADRIKNGLRLFGKYYLNLWD